MSPRSLKKRIALLSALLLSAALFGCAEGKPSQGTGTPGNTDPWQDTSESHRYETDEHGETIEVSVDPTDSPDVPLDPKEAGSCSDLRTDSLGFAVVDDDGNLFLGRNMYEAYRPASITKVLTALVTVESVSLDNEVLIPEEAVASHLAIYSSGVRPSFKPGEKVTVRDLLHALILPSTNAAGNILAMHVAGSIEAFTEMMNDRMAEMGLTHSHFVNAHGLDEEGHYTCAYDMAMVLREAVHNESLKKILGTLSYSIPATDYAGIRSMNNTHTMIHSYPGVFAGKPGSTYGAKGTLLTAFERNGKRFYGCTMHSDEGLAALDTQNIAEFAYARFNGTKTTLQAFPHDIKIVAEDESSVTVRYSTEHNAARARVVYWDLRKGTSSAVFHNNTPVGQNVEYRFNVSQKGSYAIQVFTVDAAGKEKPVQTAFLFDGAVNPADGFTDWNGQRFAFDGKGMLRIGAVETMDGHCYYANADGGLGKGFIGQFYAGPDYELVSGWFEYGGQKFYAQADGRLVKGKMIIDGVLHQFTDGGMLIE